MRFAILLLLAFALPAAAQDWTAVPTGTTGTLRALDDLGFSNYVVGDGGFVALANADHTVWTPVAVGTSDDLLSVLHPSSSQVWVGGAAGTVRVRDNLGVWNNRDVPTAEDVVLFSRTSGQALAAGSGGSLWKSDDLGQTWAQVHTGTVPLRAGVGGTVSTAWAVGDDGTILKGTEVSTVWTPAASGTTRDLLGIRFKAGNTLVAVGEAGTVLTSVLGDTWTPRASGTQRTIRAVSVSKLNADWLLAVGDDGLALKSTDSGATWCHMTTGVTADLYAADMLSNSKYLVAGEGGVLLRTTTSGGACVPGIDATATRIGDGGIPPEGGPFSFTVALSNPSPETQTFQAWVDAVLPNGSPYGPFLGPQTLTLAPGQSVGPITFTQTVPGAAPAGSYTIRLRVGDFATGALLDESVFFLSKSGVPAPSAPREPLAWGRQPSFLTASASQAASATPVRMRLAPNPARGGATLTLALEATEAVTAEVFDVQGRRVASVLAEVVAAGAPARLALDTESLAPGVYVVRVRGETFVESQRLVILR